LEFVNPQGSRSVFDAEAQPTQRHCSLPPRSEKAADQGDAALCRNIALAAETLLTKVPEVVLPSIEAHGAITSWVVDDMGIPKKGNPSVVASRQYCGQVGKQDNCQVRFP